MEDIIKGCYYIAFLQVQIRRLPKPVIAMVIRINLHILFSERFLHSMGMHSCTETYGGSTLQNLPNNLTLNQRLRCVGFFVGSSQVAGYAVGGGHVLHMVCDLTIAADNAVFGQTGPKVRYPCNLSIEVKLISMSGKPKGLWD